MKTIVSHTTTRTTPTGLWSERRAREVLRREGRGHERRPGSRRGGAWRGRARAPGRSTRSASSDRSRARGGVGEISEQSSRWPRAAARPDRRRTRELSHVERLLGHSVSEGVQRMARCDVLIVHTYEGAGVDSRTTRPSRPTRRCRSRTPPGSCRAPASSSCLHRGRRSSPRRCTDAGRGSAR